MHERPSSSNSELIKNVPHFVQEAFDNDPELARFPDFVTNIDHDEVIAEIFDNEPIGDTDKDGWLFLFGSAYRGYAIQQKLYYGRSITQGIFGNALEAQLAEDATHWGDTWKKRTIEGQLDRMYQSLRDYRDKYENGNEEFPWLKVAGGILINLYRLEHPDYQK